MVTSSPRRHFPGDRCSPPPSMPRLGGHQGAHTRDNGRAHTHTHTQTYARHMHSHGKGWRAGPRVRKTHCATGNPAGGRPGSAGGRESWGQGSARHTSPLQPHGTLRPAAHRAAPGPEGATVQRAEEPGARRAGGRLPRALRSGPGPRHVEGRGRASPGRAQGSGARVRPIGTTRTHTGPGGHSPASLVVEEQDKEELFVRLGLHVLTDLQHVQRRGRDGDPVVVARHTRHLGVDDLPREDTGSRRSPRTPCPGAGQGLARGGSEGTPPTPRHPPCVSLGRWSQDACPKGPGTWPRGSAPPPHRLRGSPGPGTRGSRCTWPTRPSGAQGRRPQRQLKSTCCSDQLLRRRGRERRESEGQGPRDPTRCTAEAAPGRQDGAWGCARPGLRAREPGEGRGPAQRPPWC